MRKIASLFAALGGMLVLFLHAVPAAAQSTRTWVSGVGDDSSTTCSRTAPCKTYAAAFALTSTGGEINCTDPGGFGTLLINKSISIVCDYTDGGVLVPASFIGFNISAPAGSIITLEGQDIECAGTGSTGIFIQNAGVAVHIHKVRIRICRGGVANSGNGIDVTNSSGLATVFVADSYITENGNLTSNAGILVRPSNGASANVSVTRTHLERNTNGIFADGTGGGGPSNVAVKDSFLSASTNAGIAVASAGAAFSATVDNTLINVNVNTGAAVAGASATLRVSGSTITQNVTGVANFGGTLQSFKNNVVAGNGTDGTPMTAFPGPGGTPPQ
jgi:hypothetical protein